MGKEAIQIIQPQPGFQEAALACEADIAIIGGAAGAGKTFALLMEILKNIEDPKFAAVYFRRTKETIRATGGLWDESSDLFPLFGGHPSESILKWRFPDPNNAAKYGATVDFEGIEYEKDLSKWQGAQIPLILYDELTEFTEKMFTFMFSRNRGICSIKPYIRASCNPDPDSWVANFIAWWIDQNTGFPIKERCGVLRYMMNHKDRIIWGDTPEEVILKCPEAFAGEKFIESGISKEDLVKSVTFIPGDVYDNKILLQHDPGYLGNLSSLSEADQARFLDGNWKIRSDGMGLYDYSAVDAMFSNELEENKQVSIGWDKNTEIFVNSNDWRNNYITCDAAKFGRDLCVIMVWRGWEVVHTTIYHISAPLDIKDEIELLRAHFKVMRMNVLIDQDGVGGDVVKLGKYYGFMARRAAAKDPDSREVENYKMRKDQCYYRSSARVNQRGIKINILPSTVKIFDRGAKNPRFSTKIKWNGEMMEVDSMIKNHLRAIKRGLPDFEGGTLKLCTNTKEEQKDILDGASPDFADVIMMREDFELSRRRKVGVKYK